MQFLLAPAEQRPLCTARVPCPASQAFIFWSYAVLGRTVSAECLVHLFSYFPQAFENVFLRSRIRDLIFSIYIFRIALFLQSRIYDLWQIAWKIECCYAQMYFALRKDENNSKKAWFSFYITFCWYCSVFIYDYMWCTIKCMLWAILTKHCQYWK